MENYGKNGENYGKTMKQNYQWRIFHRKIMEESEINGLWEGKHPPIVGI